MGSDTGFLVILQSGAGGYLGSSDEADACAYARASYLDEHGWIFYFKFKGYLSGRHRRSQPLVRLRLVSTLGSPAASAMPATLAVAGMRHCVDYVLDCE